MVRCCCSWLLGSRFPLLLLPLVVLLVRLLLVVVVVVVDLQVVWLLVVDLRPATSSRCQQQLQQWHTT